MLRRRSPKEPTVATRDPGKSRRQRKTFARGCAPRHHDYGADQGKRLGHKRCLDRENIRHKHSFQTKFRGVSPDSRFLATALQTLHSVHRAGNSRLRSFTICTNTLCLSQKSCASRNKVFSMSRNRMYLWYLHSVIGGYHKGGAARDSFVVRGLTPKSGPATNANHRCRAGVIIERPYTFHLTPFHERNCTSNPRLSTS
jgi:hypothetical protein